MNLEAWKRIPRGAAPLQLGQNKRQYSIGLEECSVCSGSLLVSCSITVIVGRAVQKPLGYWTGIKAGVTNCGLVSWKQDEEENEHKAEHFWTKKKNYI